MHRYIHRDSDVKWDAFGFVKKIVFKEGCNEGHVNTVRPRHKAMGRFFVLFAFNKY